MQETLLEQAKKIEVRVGGNKKQYTQYTFEDLELVMAWIKDEVSATQICKILGKNKNSGNYLYYIAAVLKKFYLEGKIKIELKK